MFTYCLPVVYLSLPVYTCAHWRRRIISLSGWVNILLQFCSRGSGFIAIIIIIIFLIISKHNISSPYLHSHISHVPPPTPHYISFHPLSPSTSYPFLSIPSSPTSPSLPFLPIYPPLSFTHCSLISSSLFSPSFSFHWPQSNPLNLPVYFPWPSYPIYPHEGRQQG